MRVKSYINPPGLFLDEKGGEAKDMSVELRSGESQESLLKRFRKEVVKDRILSTYRKKRWFISKSENRRLAKQRAARKARRKTMAINRNR
jgi:small subunit ribosomal protein S21